MMLIHNSFFLPVRGCLADQGMVVNRACTHCGARLEVADFFLRCQQVVDLWESLYVKLLSLASRFPLDWDLLMLVPSENLVSMERLVVTHLAVLV